jgi:hypothetical protein
MVLECYECQECGEKFRGVASFALHRAGPETARRCRPVQVLERSPLFKKNWQGVWYIPFYADDQVAMKRCEK